MPADGRASTSSPLARATPSMPPTRSVCAGATDVTTPMSGRPTAHSRVISPKPRMPISSTRTSVSAGAARIVTGRPCSLLKLRSFAATPPAGADGGQHEVLGARLADAAGDADHGGREAIARPRRQRHQGGRRCRRPRSTVIDVSTGRDARVAGGAGGHRGGDELVAVALGDERHEQLAREQRSGVERGAVEVDVGAAQRATGGSGHVGCPDPHRAERYRSVRWQRTGSTSSCCSAASRPSTT